MACPFGSSRDQFEDMDILLIGAAPAPNSSPGHEKEFRMFHSVQSDLKRIYDRCVEGDMIKSKAFLPWSKQNGYLNVRRCLVNHKELAPPVPPRSSQLERTVYTPTIYSSVEEVRAILKDFIESEAGPNLLIYYSGHGSYPGRRQGADEGSPREESLTIPITKPGGWVRSESTTLQRYTASQLTADLNAAMKSRAGGDDEVCDAKVFVVIDACHAEGLVNMWSLDGNVRLYDFVVLFAGAETQLDADYDDRGGKFTKAFTEQLRKGIKLSYLAQRVLEELYDPKKRSPCVRYSHPSLCDEHLLVEAT